MTMSIETLGAQSDLPMRPVRQGRSQAAAIEPQRPGFDLYGGKDPASRERIAP